MNIYVGNLDYQITEQDLKGVFEEYGEVKSVKIITDRETGRSKGFGFVETADDDAGQKAIDELNGAELEGRPLRVNEARRREDNNRGGGGGGYNRGGGGGYNRGGGGGGYNRGGGGGNRYGSSDRNSRGNDFNRNW